MTALTSREIVDQYVLLRRARGAKFDGAARTLYRFLRETGKPALAEVTPSAVETFLRGSGELSTTWATRCSILRGLFRFAIARGYVLASPMPEARPRLPPSITPYVYSRDELQRLLAATDALASPCSRLQATTFRTMLLLLYAGALRVGEALRLNLEDVNLTERFLTVRETKFSKTRVVPVCQAAAVALVLYVHRRSELPMPRGAQSAFFASRTGHRIGYQRVVTVFQRLRADAGIVCPPGECRPPRIHDLRHTGAVHRVVAWYRNGQDVQRMLPQLATYLGHVNIASTQRYLHMTPELLHEASMRFAAYADIRGMQGERP